ncbi:phage tail protein [Ottowia sp.]|uniref:phage tail protein n=1 Tax=Ottowia sp. TaxID=1898956 RepID=UPI003A85C7D6
MLMTLGQFQFGLTTLAFDEMQRQIAWRHPENSRVGAAPGVQYLGPEAQKITINGLQAPELGQRGALDTLSEMAAKGAAYTLTDGRGVNYGAFVIERIEQTGSRFVAEGVPRKTTFTIGLKSVSDPTQVDPAGGAGDDSAWDWDGWDWWLGQ